MNRVREAYRARANCVRLNHPHDLRFARSDLVIDDMDAREWIHEGAPDAAGPAEFS